MMNTLSSQTNKFDLSIGIINYNTRELLAQCLDSIDKDSFRAEYEIIVVDNASLDNSAKMVETNYPLVNLVENDKNIGYAGAVNQMIKKSRGNYLLILNADVIILDNAIPRTLDFLKSKPDAGFVGCKILNKDLSLQKSCRGFPNILNFLSENFFLYRLFPRFPPFGRVFMTHFDYNSERPVQVILGAFMMVSRDVIKKIGPMDDRFFMYSEETDWCFRAHNAGYVNYFYPSAKIVHLGEQSTKQHSTEMFIELHKSHHKYILKHYNQSYLYILKLIWIFGLSIRLLFALIGTAFYRLGIRSLKNAPSNVERYFKTLGWYLPFLKITPN